MSNKISKNHGKLSKLYFCLFSLYQFLLCFVLSNITFPIYGINDDSLIKSFLSGDFTGKPEYMISSSATPKFLYSLVVSTLYKINGNLEWYSYVLLLTVILSWSSIFILITKIKFYINKLYVMTYIFIFHLIFFTHYFITPTYTVAAFYPAAAASFLLVYIFVSQKYRPIDFFIITFLYTWSYSIRSEAFFFVLISLFLPVLLFLRNHKKNNSFFVKICIIIFFVITTFNFIEVKMYSSNDNWKEYKKFEQARYLIQDNLIEKKLSTNLKEYSWTKSEYDIFDNYLFSDENVFNVDKLTKVLLADSRPSLKFEVSSINLFIENTRLPYFPWMNLINSLAILVIAIALINPQNLIKNLSIQILAIFPIFIAILYIANTLRLPERIVISTLLMFFLNISLMFFYLYRNKIEHDDSNNTSGLILAIILLILITSQLKNTQSWLIDRHNSPDYRNFWLLQKNYLKTVYEPKVVIGNASQFKSDWANPYSRDKSELELRYLTLGWHIFSPLWETRRNTLGIGKDNLLSSIVKNDKLIWAGNEETPYILTNYIFEKNYGTPNLNIINEQEVGEFKIYQFTLFNSK